MDYPAIAAQAQAENIFQMISQLEAARESLKSLVDKLKSQLPPLINASEAATFFSMRTTASDLFVFEAGRGRYGAPC